MGICEINAITLHMAVLMCNGGSTFSFLPLHA